MYIDWPTVLGRCLEALGAGLLAMRGIGIARAVHAHTRVYTAFGLLRRMVLKLLMKPVHSYGWTKWL